MLSKTKLSRLIIVALLAGGCAHQTYAPKALDVRETADRFAARDLNASGLQQTMMAQGYPARAFPLETWGLRELTLAAFYFHPDLAVARARWQASRAKEITAGQKPNPSISGNFEHHSQTDGGVSPWALGIALDIPVETGNKRQARIEGATRLSEASRIEIGQQAWQIRSRLQALLIDYQATLGKAKLLDSEITLQDSIVQMLQKRLEAGVVSSIDLVPARLKLLHLKHSQAADHARAMELRAELASAIGIPAGALSAVKLDDNLPDPLRSTPLPAEEVQRAALLNRLDIRSALARYAAAESKLQLEIAKQTPDIVLSPGYMFDQGDNIWSLGISLLFGLTHKNEGPIAEAEALRELEARQFETLQARVISEQGQALAQLESRLAEYKTALGMVRTQRQHVARNERQFKAGYIDRLEWTTVQLESLAAEQGRLAAAIRLAKARAALEDALQMPLDGSVPLALPEQNTEDFSS